MSAKRQRHTAVHEDPVWCTSFDERARRDFKDLMKHMADAGLRSYRTYDKKKSANLAEIYDYLNDHAGHLNAPWQFVNERIDKSLELGFFDPDTDRNRIPCVL